MDKKHVIEVHTDKDGISRFFYAGHDITAWWMSDFAELSWEEERNCTEIFLKRNRAALKKLLKTT